MNGDPPVASQADGPLPRVVVLSFGTVGDVQPFLALAAGLRRRGHRTSALVPAFHAALVPPGDAQAATYGTPAHTQAMLADPDLWDERKGFGVVWRGLLPSLPELQARLQALAQAGPCVVLCHPFLAPVVALVREQRRPLRLVAAYLAPSSLRTLRHPLTVGSLNVPRWWPTWARRGLWAAVDRFGIDPDLLPSLNAARTAHGLAPVAHFLAHMQAAPDASVGLFPAWFGPRQPDWPAGFIEGDFPLPPRAGLRHEGAVSTLGSAPAAALDPMPGTPSFGSLGFAPGVRMQASPDAALQAFLAAGPAPVGLTAGTGHRHARAFFAEAAAALHALGLRGVIVTPDVAACPSPLPPTLHHVARTPFDRLLPRLALLVHHGGIGTTAEALRAGVPQLVVPFAFDQFDNGRRVRELGAGDVLPAARADARRLQQHMGRLLAPTNETILFQGRGPADDSCGRPRNWPPIGDQALERALDAVQAALRAAAA